MEKFDKEEPIPQWFTNVAIGHVILMCIVTVIKITLQVGIFIYIFYKLDSTLQLYYIFRLMVWAGMKLD